MRKVVDYIEKINYQKLASDMQQAIDSWNIPKYANHKKSLHKLTPAKTTYTSENVQVDFGGFKTYIVDIDLMNLCIEYTKDDSYYCYVSAKTANDCAQRIVSDFYFNDREAIHLIRHPNSYTF